jgi:hypothetical protein
MPAPSIKNFRMFNVSVAVSATNSSIVKLPVGTRDLTVSPGTNATATTTKVQVSLDGGTNWLDLPGIAGSNTAIALYDSVVAFANGTNQFRVVQGAAAATNPSVWVLRYRVER